MRPEPHLLGEGPPHPYDRPAPRGSGLITAAASVAIAGAVVFLAINAAKEPGERLPVHVVREASR
jgi:hypothetical protein